MQVQLKRILPPFIKNLVFAISCLCIYPIDILKKVTAGLDPSWEISINLAIKNKFVWGKDFVFSYGPLGYLATGVGEYVNHIPIYLFAFGLYINLCIILYKILEKSNVFTVENAIALFLFILTIHNYVYSEASTYLLLSCVFWLSHSVKNDQIISAILAIGISILMFFIKMDTGIVINVFMFMFFIYQTIYSKYKKYYPILWAINYLLLWSFVTLMHIDLYGYLLANLHVINSYNDAMYMPNPIISVGIFIAVLFFFLMLLIQNFTQIIKVPYKIIIILYLMMAIFLLFKHGFVRHSGFTFLYPPLSLVVLFLFNYFIKPDKIVFSKVIMYTLLPISLLFMTIQNVEAINKNDGQLFTFKLAILNSVSHLVLHKSYNPPASKLTGIDSSTIPYILPQRIKDKIGSGSVDIIPHLVSTIFFNQLNYNPRPGIQTYANFDGFLDSLGSTKYLSSSAPDFLIYCAENKGIDAALDKRNPFFDEPKTKLAMLQHYSVIDSFDNQILLKRKDTINKVVLIKNVESGGLFGNPIEINPSNDLQISSIKIQYSLIGKLVRFLYQPPVLNVTLSMEDGKQLTFKAIKPIIEEGILVNKLILTNRDAVNLFKCKYDSIPRVTKICFSGERWGFKSSIQLTTKFIALGKAKN